MEKAVSAGRAAEGGEEAASRARRLLSAPEQALDAAQQTAGAFSAAADRAAQQQVPRAAQKAFDARRELHAHEHRRQLAQRRGHLRPVVRQVVKPSLDVGQRPLHGIAQPLHAVACDLAQRVRQRRQFRHILPDLVQEVDHRQAELLLCRKERLADVLHQRRLRVRHHRIDRFRRARFDQELPLHTARIEAGVVDLAQRLLKQREVVRDLRAAFDGPLTKQSVQGGHLALVRHIVDGLEHRFQRPDAVALHGPCDALSGEAQLLPHGFLCLCGVGPLADVRVDTRNAGSHAVRRNAGRLHGRGDGRRSRRVNARDLAHGCCLVHALRDLRRRRGVVRAQVVDLVHQRHYLVMVEVEGGLPLRHVVARRVVFKVHSGRGDGGITQDARAHLPVRTDAGLAQGRRHLGYLFGGPWYLRAEVLDIGPHGFQVALCLLGAGGGAFRQPVHVSHHRRHIVFQLRGLGGALGKSGYGRRCQRPHGRKPRRAHLAHGGGQAPHQGIGLVDRRRQAFVYLTGDLDA